MRGRIEIDPKAKFDELDREKLLGLIARAGYCVRLYRDKPLGKTMYYWFVEYWLEPEKAQDAI